MVKKGLLVIGLSSGSKPALENVITVLKNTANSARNNKSRSSSKATPAETCGSSRWPAKRHPAGLPLSGAVPPFCWRLPSLQGFCETCLHSSLWRKKRQIVKFSTTEYFEDKTSVRSLFLLPLHIFMWPYIPQYEIYRIKVTMFFQDQK